MNNNDSQDEVSQDDIEMQSEENNIPGIVFLTMLIFAKLRCLFNNNNISVANVFLYSIF